MFEVLSNADMYQADQFAIAHGISEATLMENAGQSVAREIKARFKPTKTVIVCGPGNNGGDGYVIARALAQDGWPVRAVVLGPPERLSQTAKAMADLWNEMKNASCQPASIDDFEQAGLIVDALFGAGLSRDVTGTVADIVNAINESPAPVVSVDIPSGINGNTGRVSGISVHADLTVTFFRKKRGHVLMPGLERAGKTICYNIGIPQTALTTLAKSFPEENAPPLWRAAFPHKTRSAHKYTHGH
ncbi:MAG TPA: NAD(P)H-hydrate epimerase, partial [Hellea balneolensis]|nr:NAD(P)H-hydrate epimerase [Hellea balneolensis]